MACERVGFYPKVWLPEIVERTDGQVITHSWLGDESNGFTATLLNGDGHKDQGVGRAVIVWSPRPKGSSLVEPISDITH